MLFPEQNRANNANLCFNWFVPEDTRRHSGEALSIRQMIETMVIAQGIDRSRIFVTGLSAGGAMASVMLATYPDVFAGGRNHSWHCRMEAQPRSQKHSTACGAMAGRRTRPCRR